MLESTKKKIDEIRASVELSIIQRDNEFINTLFCPSDFWSNIRTFMNYIRFVPTEELEYIRAHIGMGFFIGNPWDADFYDGHRIRNDVEAAQHPIISKYRKYTEDLPDRFCISEPCTNKYVAQIGIKYDNKIINKDLVKEQACISNMFHIGLLDYLKDSDFRILEIGPGYGQLALHLSNAISKSKGCYICVDYPETLFWSATFIAINCPDPSVIYIYSPGDVVNLEELTKIYRYIFIPNYMSESVRSLSRLDLVINQNSFQEMTEEQIKYYLNLFSNALTGWIYSYNADRQFMNVEIERRLSDMISDLFVGGPSRSVYEDLYGDGMTEDSKQLFLGSPKSLAGIPSLPMRTKSIWVSDRLVNIEI